MNAVEFIRTKVFKLTQAPFAVIAGVSQPTVSRWEAPDCAGSEPNREEMERIRSAAIKRGLAFDDSWFFQTFPEEQVNDEAERATYAEPALDRAAS
jgi:transcriptional regulator with XRE-family HTH domain